MALDLLRELKSAGLKPNARHYKYALFACCESQGGNWKAAVKLLKEMVAVDAADKFSYGRTMLACKSAGQWQKALELLREMPGLGLVPDTFCYDIVISAGCLRNSGRQWQTAVELLKEQAEAGTPGSLMSYNHAISACRKAGRAKQAVDLLRDMRAAGCDPDLISYNTAVSACVKCRQWEQALLVLREMQWSGSGVTPDTYRCDTHRLICLIWLTADKLLLASSSLPHLRSEI